MLVPAAVFIQNCETICLVVSIASASLQLANEADNDALLTQLSLALLPEDVRESCDRNHDEKIGPLRQELADYLAMRIGS